MCVMPERRGDYESLVFHVSSGCWGWTKVQALCSVYGVYPWSLETEWLNYALEQQLIYRQTQKVDFGYN